MRKTYFFLIAVPFLTACHSLSDSSAIKSVKKPPIVIDQEHLRAEADIHYIKGERKAKMGLSQEAVYFFKQALVYDPRSFFLRSRLLEEYLRAGRYLEAFKQCIYLLEKKPDNPALRLKMGKIYENTGLYKKALAQYDRILQKNPYHTSALYRKAFLHIQRGNFSPARKALRILSQKAVKNLPQIHYLLAQVEKHIGREKQFVFHLQKALSFDPAFPAPAWDLFAFYQDLRNKPKAVSVLEELQKNIGFSPELSLTLFVLRAQEKHWLRAEPHLRNLMSVDRESWRIPLQTAWLLGREKKYNKALLVTEGLLRAFPRVSPQVYILRAGLYEQKKQPSKALQTLSKALPLFPRSEEIWFHKARIHDNLGQVEEAVNSLKKTLLLNAQYVDALNHLAFLYAEQDQNLKTAEQMALKALSLSPADAYVLDTAGWVLFKRGKAQQALQYLTQAYEKKPSEGLIVEHLAELYFHLNMLDKSVALYKEAIKLETNEQKKEQLKKKLLSIPFSA